LVYDQKNGACNLLNFLSNSSLRRSFCSCSHITSSSWQTWKRSLQEVEPIVRKTLVWYIIREVFFPVKLLAKH